MSPLNQEHLPADNKEVRSLNQELYLDLPIEELENRLELLCLSPVDTPRPMAYFKCSDSACLIRLHDLW